VVDTTSDANLTACTLAAADCSLRGAINNANGNAGTDTINFNIPGGGPQTINVGAGGLPGIGDPVVIDGTSEPDFVSTPIVELNGSGAGASPSGLYIYAGNSTVKGLVINRFGTGGSGGGIFLATGSDGTTIEGNFIGTDVNGTAALGNGTSGITIYGDGITIGGTTAAARNVISGNSSYGIYLPGGTLNVIQGNYIGIDANGTAKLTNGEMGVGIWSGSANTIGGTAAGAGNVISGNEKSGVGLIGWDADFNVVQGNLIGTDKNGTIDLGNGWEGVHISGAPNNTIGGTTAAARNVISGNEFQGVALYGAGAQGNVVQGNYIGTDKNGTAKLGNGGAGVVMNVGAQANTIGGSIGTTPGGSCTGACNVISGNAGNGIYIVVDPDWNVVWGNYIGSDVTGTANLGNSLNGVEISYAPDNEIGGSIPETRNIISGNNQAGVLIEGIDATGNFVWNNYIGTQTDGTSELGNTSHGILVTDGASNNYIGWAGVTSANTIAFNGGDGVMIDSGTGNEVRENSIHNNDGLGIDLAPNGVTPNDTGDPDAGANNKQNYPILTSASVGGGSTTVQGELNSTASTQFDIDFFQNVVYDPSLHGEGLNYLGSKTVTTGGDGWVVFTATGLSLAQDTDGDGWLNPITATATNTTSWDTSEFSEYWGDNCPEDVNPDQRDMDDDGMGNHCDDDTDGDGDPNVTDPDDDEDLVKDVDEVACGSDELHDLKTPERLGNGADDDGDGSTDEVQAPVAGFDCDGDGFDDDDESALTWPPDDSGHASGDETEAAGQCDDIADDDGDTIVSDGCPEPGTGYQERCADTAGGNNENDDQWPADFNDDGKVNLQDVGSYNAPIKHYNQTPLANHARWNLAGGTTINLQDVNTLSTLKPGMFKGEKAYNNTMWGIAGTCPAD
jgi:hypothetical protein